MSVFEIAMLLCFGAAWPFSLIKSWTTRSTRGKSLVFLVVVFAGYLAGITHKLLYSRDAVIFFYGLNALMVGLDIGLYFVNLRRERRAPR